MNTQEIYRTEEIPINNLALSCKIYPKRAMRIVSVSEPQEHPETSIEGSRYYTAIKFIAKQGITTNDEGGIHIGGEVVKPPTEVIFERSSPEIYRPLVETVLPALDANDPTPHTISLIRIDATTPLYYPLNTKKERLKDANGKDVVLSTITFYMCEGENIQTRLRRKLKNLEFVVPLDIDPGELNDSKLRGEAKENTK